MILNKDSFLSNVKEKSLILQNDKVICALSGGKDSVVLLYLLHEIQSEIGFELKAIHINHGIRGNEADFDEKFSEELCHSFGIDFKAIKVNVPSFAKANKKGLEESARILRYDSLYEELSLSKFTKIAVAHSLSDQAETVLFHIIRGSGIKGLCGMNERTNSVIRPLLPFSTDEIVAFAKEKDLRFVFDSSNSDNNFSRNNLRNEILPKIKEINSNVEKSLFRLSENSKMADRFIKSCLAEKFGNSFDKLPLSILSDLTKTSDNDILIFYALEKMCEIKKISFDNSKFNAVLSLIKKPVGNKFIEIEKGFSFSVKKDFLVLEKRSPSDCIFDASFKLKVGSNLIDTVDSELTIKKIVDCTYKNVRKDLKTAAFSCRINGILFLRFPNKKDTIRMNSMNKNVYQFFKDSKIPIELRKFIPVVCDEKEIIWVPFFGLCDKVREKSSLSNELLEFELKGNIFNEIKQYI